MGQLNLIIETLDEYRLVAKELGERLAPFFAPPKKMNVIRVDIAGDNEAIRAAFLQSIASAMMFNKPLTPPTNPFAADAYTYETRTAAGVSRQAIIVDSQGLDFSLRKQSIPERTSPGPLFVQNPDYDCRLDAANAAKIDVSPHASVKIQRYAKNLYGLGVDIALPDFPMERFKQALIRRDILSPPRRNLPYPL